MLLLLSIFSIRGSSSVIRYGSQVVNWGGDDLVPSGVKSILLQA